VFGGMIAATLVGVFAIPSLHRLRAGAHVAVAQSAGVLIMTSPKSGRLGHRRLSMI
jgi:hypothetical protein